MERAVLTAVAELVLREARSRKQPRKSRTQTFTNKVHGIDKKTRTHADLMDELKQIGHAGGGDPVDLPLDKAQENWSPQARAAAAAARKSHGIGEGHMTALHDIRGGYGSHVEDRHAQTLRTKGLIKTHPSGRHVLTAEGRKVVKGYKPPPVQEAALSSGARKDLPATAFVFPKDKRYPIYDLSHARNALARASGKPEEGAVKAAVYRKYPQLKGD